MKRAKIGAFIIIIIVWWGYALALDPPHDGSDPLKPVNCNSCHTLHHAPSPSLTVGSSNANTCMGSCHNPTGLASGKPFNDIDQANTAAKTGTSHRWDVRMAPAADPLFDPTMYGPGSKYGLRKPAADQNNPQPDEIQNAALNVMLKKFDYVVTCSLCHQQHSQAQNTWDPSSPIYGGAETGSGRHFQRLANDLNQLCEDCHYYQTAATETDVRTYTGNKKSHPVVKNLTTDVNDPSQFVGAAPLDRNFNPQSTPPRYHQNGTLDTNATNNIVLDSSSKVRCLSCHGIHYTDSDSTTEDQP